ncbi:hypothetical protein BH10PLA2_BH10PLA2_09820 [soil metagenome]
MAKPSSLTAQDRDNLVAYLDGELDERTVRALEAKLSRDALARAELEALKRTYNLLDFLPRGEASSQFASNTIDRLATVPPATVAADAESSFNERKPLKMPSRWPLLVGWSCAIFFAAFLSYFMTRAYWLRKRPVTPIDTDAALVQDLRVIENKRLFDHVDEINFLRSLDVSNLFSDEH